MASEAGLAPEPKSIVCRLCGTVNAYSDSFCRRCWSPLAAGRVVSATEAQHYQAGAARRARWAGWRRRALLGMLAAAIATLLGFWVHSPPPSSMPSGATSISSASAPGEWAMDGHNLAHTRSIPQFHTPISGRLKWSVSLDALSLTAPVVADGTIYLATGDGRALALNAATGAQQWQREVGSPADSSPALAGDSLYLALRDRRLLALDRATGEAMWTFVADGPLVAPPAVMRGVVYVVSAVDGRLMAVDATAGRELWQDKLEDSWITSAPSWAGHTIVVATANKVFYFDTLSGDNVFTYELPIGNVVGAPAIVAGTAYVAVDRGGIVALAVEARAPFWEQPIRPIWGQLWLWGMAPRPPRPSGLLWGYGTRGRLSAPPAVTEEAIYYGTSRGLIVALHRGTREVIWSFQAGGEVRSAPALAGDTAYVGAGNRLYALKARTGEVAWSFQTAKNIGTPVVVTAGGVYIADQGGTLYAIE